MLPPMTAPPVLGPERTSRAVRLSLSALGVALLIVAAGCGRTPLRVPSVDRPPVVDEPSPEGDASTEVPDVVVVDTPHTDAGRDVRFLTDALYCNTDDPELGGGVCHQLVIQMGIFEWLNEEFRCCNHQCYMASACTPAGPEPAICDLSERPCGPAEACCYTPQDRLMCSDRLTLSGCIP